MMQQPNCHRRACKHFLGLVQPHDDESGEWPNCKAFPQGIPVSIAYGAVPHDKPYPQDGGYRYERERG